MISIAGKRHQTSSTIVPLNTTERFKIYESEKVKVNKKIPIKKDLSFDTINRDQMDSFMLRSNKQIVTNVNYHPNFSFIQHLTKRTIIDKAKFERIIGPVRNNDYSVQLSQNCNHRCRQSLNPIKIRGSRQHLSLKPIFSTSATDNAEQSVTYDPKAIKSTEISHNNNTVDLVESRIIRQKNHKMKLKNIHSFDSYSGHQFLKNLGDVNQIERSHQNINIKDLKGYVKFPYFRQKIISRLDRVDPYWNTLIDDRYQSPKIYKSFAMQSSTPRKINEVHSKYPIRLSLQKITKEKLDK